MIVLPNIIELALDFHGDERGRFPSMDRPHVSAFLAQRRGSHVEPQRHLPDERVQNNVLDLKDRVRCLWCARLCRGIGKVIYVRRLMGAMAADTLVGRIQ
jgi:hypothetical protein